MVVFHHPRTRTTMLSAQATGNVYETREEPNTSSPFLPRGIHSDSPRSQPPRELRSTRLIWRTSVDEAQDLTSPSNSFAIVSHLALSAAYLLSTSLSGLCSYQHIGVRINLWSTRGTSYHRW